MGALDYQKHYTYDDYKEWEGNWELYEGFPIAMSPAPMINHQMIAYAIAGELRQSIKDKCKRCAVFGEADYKVADDTIVRPDVVLTCNETGTAYLTKAPEVIFEIISKSTAKNDENYKFDLYEKEKVKYYCIVYPDDLKVKIFKLDGKNYTKEGDFFKETYTFEESSCKATIDFSEVFEKFE